MDRVEFVGKSVLINGEKEKILVLSDLHLGYGESLRRGGIFVFSEIHKEVMTHLEKIFSRVGRVGKIILLGDVKHEIGKILQDERTEMELLFKLMNRWCEEIIIVKGNHDVLLEPMLRGKKVELVDFYINEGHAFLHGDKDYDQIHGGNVGTWLIGHVHPAITLRDESKEEKYKCFLDGKYKGKRVIILPSFFPVVEGSGVDEVEEQLIWPFELGKFVVRVVGEELEVMDFGEARKIGLQ